MTPAPPQPIPTRRRVSLPFIALLLVGAMWHAQPSCGLILYGRNNTQNLTPPANGAPWSYAVKIGNANASGVYLGNGFVLTAHHVFLNANETLTIDSQSYSRNTTWLTSNGSVQSARLVSGNDTLDAKVIRIEGNPSLPALAPLAIAMNGTDTDTNRNATLIGSGKGKGLESPPDTFAWADNTTRIQRWGTVRTTTQTTEPSTLHQVLATRQRSDATADEAAATEGDSGAPLFINYGSSGNPLWKLAGLAFSVTHYGFSVFAPAPSPPHFTYNGGTTLHVRLAPYAHLLRFDHWRNRFLGNATAPSNGDPDGDGMPHLLEYVADADPTAPDASRAPVGGFETEAGIDYVTLTYWQRVTATDVAVSIEESTDLESGSWTPAVSPSFVVLTGTAETSVWRYKARVPTNGAPRKFLRLRIDLLP